jgi:hypothetical protein
MLRVEYSTQSTPGQRNEDYVVVGPDWAVVLDGATAPPGVNSGCIHDVPWLVRHLGGELARSLSILDSQVPLTGILASAIQATCNAHASTCDLDNPASPSSTVAIARIDVRYVEYLSLADSALVLDVDGKVEHIVDDRTSHLADYSVEGVRAVRNQPGTPERPSFWVASTKPEAAYKSVTEKISSSQVRRVALLSDGASRWVDRFNLGDWSDLLDVLTNVGPTEIISQVRAAELDETDDQRVGRRGKRHDDATAVLIHM